MIVYQNQLDIRFIDVTLDASQKYLLHSPLNYEIISLSLLTQYSLSLQDIHTQPITEEVSSAVVQSLISPGVSNSSQDFPAQISATIKEIFI